jgi:hypothetical protein
VGFEFTFESKCNCLLDYIKCVAFGGDDTCGVFEDLTRNDLNSLDAACIISDAVIPAGDPLRTGTGAVIGSYSIGDESFCYSVSDRDDMEEGRANYHGSLAAQFLFIRTFPHPIELNFVVFHPFILHLQNSRRSEQTRTRWKITRK